MVSNNKNKQSDESLSDVNLIKIISTDTVDKIEKTYYLYTANIVKK